MSNTKQNTGESMNTEKALAEIAADLRNADLRGTVLRNANADLRGVDLWHANLRGIDLRNAVRRSVSR